MKQAIAIAILVFMVCGCKSTSFEVSKTETTVTEQQAATNPSELMSTAVRTEAPSNTAPTEAEVPDEKPLQRIVINSDALNVRHTHDVKSEPLGVVERNVIYTVLEKALDGEGKTWHQIAYSKNELGWIAGWHCIDFMEIPIVQNLLGDWLYEDERFMLRFDGEGIHTGILEGEYWRTDFFGKIVELGEQEIVLAVTMTLEYENGENTEPYPSNKRYRMVLEEDKLRLFYKDDEGQEWVSDWTRFKGF